MKAAVIYEPGGPEVLKLESQPICKPQEGQVLIRVKAFGLNRSELFTRQGHSPGVPFPRILGIEAVGIVEEASGREFRKGQRVATAMGGLGQKIDGGYAEYTCVPALQVQAWPACSLFASERSCQPCVCRPALRCMLVLTYMHMHMHMQSSLHAYKHVA